MRSLLLFIFCQLALDAVSQTRAPLVLYNITEQNGLSDDHVQCVMKDRNNFVWIGTADGLNLMDGSTIKVFRHKEGDSTSLPGSNIVSLTQDSTDNTIYIGTTRGLCWFDKISKTFHSSIPPASPYGASFDIEGIVRGHGNDLWVGTDGGLFLFNLANRTFTSYYNSSTDEGSEPKYTNRLTYILSDKRGMIWLCSNDGLWVFDTATKTFRKIIHKNNDPFYHPLCMYACIDHDENIWAGFWNTGLKKYDTHTGRVTSFEHKVNNNHTVSCFTELKQPDGSYVLWINGDMLAFDEQKSSYFNFPEASSQKNFPAVSPLYQSEDGWVWLGSDKGLYIYNPQRQLFRHHPFDRPITSQGITFFDYHGGVLAGAEGANFLKWYDSSGNLEKDFSTLGKGTALLCIRKDHGDDFWIGTSGGVLHADLSTKHTTWYQHKEGDSTTVPRNFIANLFIDTKGRVWLFPWREGIWQLDKTTGKCTRLLEGFIPEINRTKRLLISDAVEDDRGNIWMCDLDEGIVLYDASTGKFSKPFTSTLGERYGTSRIFLQGHTAYSFIGNAIIKWDVNERKVHQINLPAEMDKGLMDMYPDKDGNWWMTSRNGLIVYNDKDSAFNRFTVADGLIQNDVNASVFCTAAGQMILGAPGYFTFFKPESLTRSSVTKKNMSVTEILVNDKPTEWRDGKTVSLSYRENNIVVRWALPDYGNPFRNQYYVRLTGIDGDWRYVGNNGEIQYANLSPGSYTIQLKAATANGVSSQNIHSVKFVIRPPLWKTWWFICLVSVVLVTLFVLVIRYVSQRNLKERLMRLQQEKAIEKERNRISRDMHDDLGSGLTKIAIMSEVVKKQIHDPEKAKQQLEHISESSRELVDNLQDIIWVLNPKNDTLESLAAYIREYALKFFEPFEIEISFNYPAAFGSTRLSEETRRNLFLVVKESFNNIAKHAWCDHVCIGILQTSSAVELRIKDDGKGFDPEKVRQFGNGLINMRTRIEQIGGVYRLHSQPGAGTETEVRIPAE